MESTVHSMTNVELLSACSALGCLEGNKYQKEPDCLETLKDLIRFLRREDETCDVRRQLGNTQILQNDLLYIIKQYHKDTDLFETTVRLLVNLTQAPEICFQKVPEDKMFRNYFLETLSHLQSYKEAFADEDFMTLLARKLKKLLDLDWDTRHEDHTILMERILLLLRNILHIPADPNYEKRTDDDASVHDQVLWALNITGMDKLILYIASSEAEQQWCMHAVEIISLMFREQTPEQVATAGEARLASERQKDERELELMRQREQAEKRAKVKASSARHSRFGGTFCVMNLKSISERDVIYHSAVQNSHNISFDVKKEPKKKPKNRMPMKETSVTRRSTLSIRLFLKEFCILFVENCYNSLMHAVKDHIVHQRAQENDDSFYLWAIQFFMDFNRLHQFRVDIVSETFSLQTFFYVQTQLVKYLDMMAADKKEATTWSKRMHLALRAYGALTATLDKLSRSSDTRLKESAQITQSNIFYTVEYREVFLMLLKKYDEVKSTRSYLKDLIETTHTFVKMLEHFCRGKNSIMVQRKKQSIRSRRRRQPKAQRQNNSQQEEDQEKHNALWYNITSDLSAMLQGREDIPEDVVPFDATSDIPVEEQRANAMVKIQRCLRIGDAGQSIALLRAARDVWPDNDVFGAVNIAPEEEFMALREIHFTNLNVDVPEPVAELEDDNDDQYEDEEDEIVEADRDERSEEEFNFKIYINKFCHPDIIRCYVKLLADYRTNSSCTNHCIIKMLHRVAVDCQKVPLLFQISLFRVFQKVLNDPIGTTNDMKEIFKFSRFVLAKFFEKAATNKKMFMELLFWKDTRDIYEITEGYGSVMEKQGKKGIEWREEEQEELSQLYEEYKNTDGDVVDHIKEHIIDDSRTRRQIITQLQRQGIVESAADLKRKKGSKRPALWREEHELELRNLYDQHKNSDDVLGNILDCMTEKRSKTKVVEKLLGLGLVEDRKELYRKRGGGRKRVGRLGNTDDEDDEDDVDDGRNFIDDMDEEPDFEGFLAQHARPDGASAYDSETEAGSSSDESVKDETSEERSLQDVMKRLQEKGFTKQIEWIQGGLRATAVDREKEEVEEPIPVVPLSEENEDAINHKMFQSFLRILGITPPGGSENDFWNIPGDLTPDRLREMAELIQPQEYITLSSIKQKKKANSRYKALKEVAKSCQQQRQRDKETKTRRDKGTKRRANQNRTKEKLQTMLTTNVVDRVMDEDFGKNDKMIDQQGEKFSTKKQRVKRSLQSDSSDDSDTDDSLPLKELPTSYNDTFRKPAAKRSRMILSSDEDEADRHLIIANRNHTEEKNGVTIFKENNLDLPLNPDSEDSDDEMLLHKVARRHIIESDSEED